MTDAGDRRRVQRAALRVGAVVGIGSAVVLTGGVAILVTVLLAGGARTTRTITAAPAALTAAMATAS